VQGPFEVGFAGPALEDLERLFDFLIERATTEEDLALAQRAVDEIQAACQGNLGRSPFSYRRAGTDPLRRELIIPFGATGYVAQFVIEPDTRRVVVLAVRHQREEDFH